MPSVSEPLRKLIHKAAYFVWELQENAFQKNEGIDIDNVSLSTVVLAAR